MNNQTFLIWISNFCLIAIGSTLKRTKLKKKTFGLIDVYHCEIHYSFDVCSDENAWQKWWTKIPDAIINFALRTRRLFEYYTQIIALVMPIEKKEANTKECLTGNIKINYCNKHTWLYNSPKKCSHHSEKFLMFKKTKSCKWAKNSKIECWAMRSPHHRDVLGWNRASNLSLFSIALANFFLVCTMLFCS